MNKIAELLLRKQKLLELRQGEPGPNELVDIDRRLAETTPLCTRGPDFYFRSPRPRPPCARA